MKYSDNLWKEILEKELNILDEDLINLMKNFKFVELWEKLITLKKEYYFNYLISIIFTIRYIEFETSFNIYEQEVYKNKTSTDIILTIAKTINLILSSHFSEMISKDIDLTYGKLEDKKMWIAINLDSFYFISLDHIEYDINIKLYKNKDMDLIKKKKDISVIISTLERIRGVIFFTNLGKKKNTLIYPNELLESVTFTKGYLVCFPPELFEILKTYKYNRKLTLTKPENIEKKIKNMTLIEMLENKNFSKSIWMNEYNLTITDFEKYKIYNKKLLYKKVNTKTILNSLNYLNSIKLKYEKNIFNTILRIAEKNEDFSNQLSHKTTMENYILHIKTNNLIESQSTEITSDFQTALKSAAILDLIEKQLKIRPNFYLNYKLDHRLRIYAYPWPINYQLNHVIRTSLNFYNSPNLLETHYSFLEYPLVKKYITDDIEIEKILFEHLENKEIEKTLNNMFLIYNVITENEIEEKCVKEFLYQTIIKLAPKKIKKNIEKFDFVCKKLDKFIKADLTNEIKNWLNEFKFKEKKTPYLVYYQKTIINIFNSNFNSISWADASSNAIQLIILRNLKNFDSEEATYLLKLVNIYDNDTSYSNIYEYLTEKIKERDHSEIIKKTKNKLNIVEIIKLQENDNNKYLLMPLVYGMGKISYREKLDKMISSDDRNITWNKLDYKEKNIISDYFWDCAIEEINKLGFDMQEYKKLCNENEIFDKFDTFIWKTDLGLPIAPVSIINSKRSIIKKEIKKLKIKEKLDGLNKDEEEKLEKLEKKLEKDDKIFWHRHRTITNKNNIYSRIYYKKKYDISKRETRQSIIPNTIHAYDASIIHIVIQICKKLKIEILVIHDSIGAQSILLPYVKIIFKIVNILLIEVNNNRKLFPFNKPKKISENEIKKLKIEILKSKNFFK